MKLPMYVDVLQSSEEDKNGRLVKTRVERARQQLKLRIAEVEEKIARKEASVQEECNCTELSFDAIIERQDELGLLNRKLNQLNNMLEDMFPEK